jgi:hypothetical protein
MRTVRACIPTLFFQGGAGARQVAPAALFPHRPEFGRHFQCNQPRSTGTKICASSRWISNAMLSPA